MIAAQDAAADERYERAVDLSYAIAGGEPLVKHLQSLDPRKRNG